MNHCFICDRTDIPDWNMIKPLMRVCRPCHRDYINFRRAFKVENKRWPTMAEFKDEEF